MEFLDYLAERNMTKITIVMEALTLPLEWFGLLKTNPAIGLV